MDKERYLDIGSKEVVFRKIADRTIHAIMGPYEFKTTTPDTMAHIQELIDQGTGVLFVGNHFSQRETLETLPVFFDRLDIWKNPIAYLIAAHQKNPVLGALAYLTHTEPQHIVTDETVRRDEKKAIKKLARMVERVENGSTNFWNFFPEDPREILGKIRRNNDGLTEGISAIQNVLRSGGISHYYLQGTRRPEIHDMENPPALSTFLLSARRNKLPDFAIVFFGVDLEEVDDLNEARKFNFRKKYTYNVDEPVMVSEFLTQAQGIRKVDALALERVANLVSEKHSGKPFSRGSNP